LLLSWHHICTKLRIEQPESTSESLIENIVTSLLEDASIRTRQKPSVLIEGLATLPKLKSANALGVSTTGLEEQYLDTLNNTKSPVTTSVPSRRVEPKPEKKGKSGKKSRRHTDIMTVEVYGKPKTTTENWIPEIIRFKSIERDLAVATRNLRDAIVLESESKKEMKRLSQSVLARAHIEESLGSKKKINCGCCAVLFSEVNLTLQVSIKAVSDLRRKWISGKPTGYDDDSGAKIGVVPHCYDQVGVCRFCAQFFYDQESYRPSFDSISYEERRKLHFETLRQEKEYWDPLKMCAKDEELMKQLKDRQDNESVSESP
jgi:hypothetical protein